METSNSSIFNNDRILSWLKYFSDQVHLNLEKVKILDITVKNKNLIPMIESYKRVLVFADGRRPDLFYDLWEAGLGEMDIWFREGLNPSGGIKCKKIRELIKYKVTGPCAMLILNINAKSTYTTALKNCDFFRGSIRYVGHEIRAVILNMLHIDTQDIICIISGESIAVQASMIASEGTIIAVEYDKNDQHSMQENVDKFDLQNVEIVENTKTETLSNLPIPSLSFIVATDKLESEIENLLQINPHMQFVIYTLELNILSEIPAIFKRHNIRNMEIMQISVSKLNNKNVFEAQPAPWIISGEA